MSQDILDDTPKKQRPTTFKLALSSVLGTFLLIALGLAHYMFHHRPSLAYLILFYISGFIAILTPFLIVLARPERKVWTACITLGAIGAVIAPLSLTNDTLMLIGQITTGIAFMFCVALQVLIWKE